MIKQQSLLSPFSFPDTRTITGKMTIDEPEENATADHILDWLEGSISYLPSSSFFDDPYSSGDITDNPWWVPGHNLNQDLIGNNNNGSASVSLNNNSNSSSTSITASDLTTSNHPLQPDISKKRKVAHDSTPKAARKNQSRRIADGDDIDLTVEPVGPTKRPTTNKKGNGKPAGNNGNNSNNKEGRWAEQLLNPCAAAIAAGDLNRVQHLLLVIHELASPTGDANYRLAAHGLQALNRHPYPTSTNNSSSLAINFASAKPKFFQQSIINFNDINPWFTIPNNVANNSILQVLSLQDRSKALHIVDIGVSHGVQWPTLLEALTRRSGGPPPLVRLTVIPPSTTHQSDTIPFATGPAGYNFSSNLLRFSKAININLDITTLDNQPLQNLNAQMINSAPDETLIVCAQFRLHYLTHSNPDHRTDFLRALQSLEPNGVILSENNVDCSCSNCGDFPTGFSRRVEYLWSFLDSTSAAFKGRESEERRMMEGEAAKALTNAGEMSERKEKWGERMMGVGFVGEVFGEDIVDGARALLRKYDSNWEMKVDERDGCVCLGWKGQPVSFCSLWKMDQSRTLT